MSDLEKDLQFLRTYIDERTRILEGSVTREGVEAALGEMHRDGERPVEKIQSAIAQIQALNRATIEGT